VVSIVGMSVQQVVNIVGMAVRKLSASSESEPKDIDQRWSTSSESVVSIRRNRWSTCVGIFILVKKHGDQVPTELLDTYEIDLTECMRYQTDPLGMLTSYFLSYKIVSNPFNNIHKISFHD
jgi:hypothetical protein